MHETLPLCTLCHAECFCPTTQVSRLRWQGLRAAPIGQVAGPGLGADVALHGVPGQPGPGGHGALVRHKGLWVLHEGLEGGRSLRTGWTSTSFVTLIIMQCLA